MKGVILRGFRNFVEDRAGPAAWSEIVQRTSLDEDFFVVAHSYPDTVAFALVEQAAGVLELEPDQILRSFGRHWMHGTGARSYPQVFELARRDPVGLLRRLDQLHDAATRNLDGALPPMVRVFEDEGGDLTVEYASSKRLPHLAWGLLEGLGEISAGRVTVDAPEPVPGRPQCWTFRLHVHSKEPSWI